MRDQILPLAGLGAIRAVRIHTLTTVPPVVFTYNTMKTYTAKIHGADRAVGHVINLAIVERIFDRDNNPLSDSIVGVVDCRIVEVLSYWSVPTRGESGRWYGVAPMSALPVARADREILIGIG